MCVQHIGGCSVHWRNIPAKGGGGLKKYLAGVRLFLEGLKLNKLFFEVAQNDGILGELTK